MMSSKQVIAVFLFAGLVALGVDFEEVHQMGLKKAGTFAATVEQKASQLKARAAELQAAELSVNAEQAEDQANNNQTMEEAEAAEKEETEITEKEEEPEEEEEEAPEAQQEEEEVEPTKVDNEPGDEPVKARAEAEEKSTTTKAAEAPPEATKAETEQPTTSAGRKKRKPRANKNKKAEQPTTPTDSSQKSTSTTTSSAGPGRGKKTVPLVRKKSVPLPYNYTRYDEGIPLTQQIPNLILGGAQKGGTTAIGNILGKHPDFLREKGCNKGFEFHYWDVYLGRPLSKKKIKVVTEEEWDYFRDDPVGNMDNRTLEQARVEYTRCWHNNTENLVSLEKTPEIMIMPQLPYLISTIVPWTLMLFVVRDPVSRTYSAWKMRHSRKVHIDTEPFEHYIEREIAILRELNLSKAPTIQEFSAPGYVLDPTAFDIPSIDERRRIKQADGKMIHKKSIKKRFHESWTYLYRGMYAELLVGWMEYFDLGTNLMVLTSDRYTKTPLETMHDIQRFVGAPQTHFSHKTLTTNYHGGYKAAPMSNATKDYLTRFFHPYNEELRHLMGPEWWDFYVFDSWGKPSS